MSAAVESQKKLQVAMQYEGSEQKKSPCILCTLCPAWYQLRRAIGKEFVTLIGILAKSKHMKSSNSQMGKGNMTHGKGKRKRK